MSSFEEFMSKAEELPSSKLPASNVSLLAIETSLTLAVTNLVTPFLPSSDKKQKFSEKVSNLVRDKEFISEFSEHLGVPSELETEDEFVKRGNSVLRKMLHNKFGIKS
jgi:hypothetical protein